MLKVYHCNRSPQFKGIVDLLNGSQEDYRCVIFSDGEMEVHFEKSIRNDDVFLIQSITSADALLELMLAINAAKLASAKSVTAVIPYLGYARQDRKSCPRVSLGAKVVLQAIESAGAGRIITMDLHAAQEVGFVNIPVDHLRASSIFIPCLKNIQKAKHVLVAPDAGAAKNVGIYSKELQIPMAMCHKHREVVNQVDSMQLVGSVKGKHAVVIDDMVDTAGTLQKCAFLLKESGALSVKVVATHMLLSTDKAIERLKDSPISSVYVTNTVNSPRVELLSMMMPVEVEKVDKLFASAIECAYKGESIEELYCVRQ